MGTYYTQKSQTPRRKELRNNATTAEQRLWFYIKGKQLGYKFRRQHGADVYILDFYCPEKRLAIELDGESHLTKKAIRHDKTRNTILKQHGIKTIRFKNQQIMNEIQSVLEEIKKELSDFTTEPKIVTSPWAQGEHEGDVKRKR